MLTIHFENTIDVNAKMDGPGNIAKRKPSHVRKNHASMEHAPIQSMEWFAHVQLATVVNFVMLKWTIVNRIRAKTMDDA